MPAVDEIDERVGAAREPRREAATGELGPQQFADPQRDVFLDQPAGKVQARIPRVRSTVPGIDHDGVP